MSRHSMNLGLVLVFSLCGLSSAAWGVEFQICDFEITNTSGAARTQLHLEFAGTGGTAELDIYKNAPGCADPVAVTNPGSPWDITWPNACVGNNEVIVVRIQSEKPLVVFSSGNWDSGAAAVSADDVVRVRCIPTLSQWGLIALTLILLAAGTVVLRRRSALA